jgi:AcrR family transcriptional regulator
MKSKSTSKSTRALRTLSSRDGILRAARRLLIRTGHEQLSLREVARAARLAPSSLYEHFSNREALLEALAVEALHDLRKALLAACNVGGGFLERLLSAAMTYLEFSVKRRSEFELIFSRPRPTDQVEPPADSPLLPIVIEIARALGSGECLAPAGQNALDMAFSLWAQVHGMAVLRSRYLANTIGFEDKARQILSATLLAWSSKGALATTVPQSDAR